MNINDEALIRRPDGSLDCAVYMKRGRMARARQARQLTRTVVRPLPRIGQVMAWATLAFSGVLGASYVWGV